MSTPCELVFRGDAGKAEHRLILSKRGFRVATLTLLPADEKVSVKLESAPTDGPPGSPDTPPPAVADVKTTPAAATTAAPSAEPAAALAVVAPPPAEPSAEPSAKPTLANARPEVMRFQDGMSRPVMISGHDVVYPREARLSKVQGTVIAKCVITASGSVTNCRIIKGLPHLDDAVLSALSSRRYQPIMYEGHPVSVDYVFPMKMVPPP
jgi:TonB family protein